MTAPAKPAKPERRSVAKKSSGKPKTPPKSFAVMNEMIERQHGNLDLIHLQPMAEVSVSHGGTAVQAKAAARAIKRAMPAARTAGNTAVEIREEMWP